MTYLVLEILVYLGIAAVIGFVLGWVYRGASLETSTKSIDDLKSRENETVEVQKAQTEKPEIQKSQTKESEPQEAKKEEKVLNDEEAPELFTQAPQSGQDKLSTIKGIGPVIERQLNELGVYQFEQIASWTTEQELWIGSKLAFPKRVTREEWVKQAKELVKHKAEKI